MKQRFLEVSAVSEDLEAAEAFVEKTGVEGAYQRKRKRMSCDISRVRACFLMGSFGVFTASEFMKGI